MTLFAAFVAEESEAVGGVVRFPGSARGAPEKLTVFFRVTFALAEVAGYFRRREAGQPISAFLFRVASLMAACAFEGLGAEEGGVLILGPTGTASLAWAGGWGVTFFCAQKAFDWAGVVNFCWGLGSVKVSELKLKVFWLEIG